MSKEIQKKGGPIILSILLATVLIFTCLYPTQPVLAEKNGVTDPGNFEFDPEAGAITGYDTAGGSDVVIPAQIDGVDVKEIGVKNSESHLNLLRPGIASAFLA
ncbi:MAG: hypothetical protein ACLFN4_07965 [Candidatus Acetothermia bacterium]